MSDTVLDFSLVPTVNTGDFLLGHNSGSNGEIRLTAQNLSSALATMIRPTWDHSGTDFVGVDLDVTNTASGPGSALMDLKVGAASKFKVDKDGNLDFAGGALKHASINILAHSDTTTTLGKVGTDTLNIAPKTIQVQNYDFFTHVSNIHYKFGHATTGTFTFDGARPIKFYPAAPYGVSLAGSSGGWINLYQFEGDGGTTFGGLGAYGGGDTITRWFIGAWGNEAMSIKASNNYVGIGETNPSYRATIKSPGSSQHVLAVLASDSTFLFGLTESATGSANFTMRNSSGSELISLKTEADVFFNNSGDFAIGHAAPLDKLHVSGGDIRISGSTTPGVKFYDDDVSGYSQVRTSNAGLYLEADPGQLDAGSFIGFAIDGSEAARISDLGKMGIGTDAPSNRLHLGDGLTTWEIITIDASLHSAIDFSNSSNTWRVWTSSNNFYLEPETNNGYFYIRNSSNSNVYSFDVNDPAIILYGSTPRILFSDDQATGIGRIRTNNEQLRIEADYSDVGDGSSIALVVDNSEKARITEDGLFGLGTTSPTELFHMRGSSSAGLNPITALIHDTSSSAGWAAGADFARVAFYSGDVSGVGAGIRAAVAAYQSNAEGEESGLNFYISNTTDGIYTKGASLTENGTLIARRKPYGILAVEDNSTATTISAASTWTKLTVFDTEASNLFTASHSNDEITLEAAGGSGAVVVQVTCNITCDGAGDNKYQFGIYKNGVRITGSLMTADFAKNSGDEISLSKTILAEMADGDDIDVRVQNTANADDITVSECYLSVSQ